MTLPLSDAEFVASRELSTREICRIFGVPPSIVNAQSGGSLTYSTSQQEMLAFYQLTLQPLFVAIETALSQDPDLFPITMTGCQFDTDQLLRADLATRYASYVQGLGAGFLTVDEVRAREGLGPMPEGASVDPLATQAAQQLALARLQSAETGG